ncbi:MAG: neuraminidase-like domain-containing protein, partial [Bacteroidia bacterium]
RAMPFSNLEAYFHVPENDQFVTYWGRVEDRLYKIRNGLNIKGIRQKLALFEPPINPLQLIQAASAGGNFLDVATRNQTDVPIYRFNVVIEKAKNFAQTVIQLGASLLSALEKKDAEKLMTIHSSQEVTIQNMMLQIKQQQIKELEQQVDGLLLNKESAQNRFNHYEQLEYMNAFESRGMQLMARTASYHKAASLTHAVSAYSYILPTVFGLSNGGANPGAAISATASVFSEEAAIQNQIASILNTKASYERRKEEWKLQKEIAQFEVDQIEKQIDATQTRMAMAQQELNIQRKTISNVREVDAFLKSKFTNAQLYQWIIGRLSSLYFETYKLSTQMAMMAQEAYNFELDTTENFIAFDSWDNLHKGLLAGEGLMFSLQQMEKAHLINNTRRFEIEKTISLRQHAPEEFLKFKWGNGGEKGTLRFQLNQSMFDFDFPNQYARKIKAISISIPAVVGPYQSINATLTQNNSAIIMQPQKAAVEYLLDPQAARPDTQIIRENWIPSQQIALSKGIDDTGMFMLNFNDERYLPFEGTGAVSSWTLQMPPETNRFNFDSISDVLVKVYYTALDGGQVYGKEVMKLHKTKMASLPQAKLVHLKQAFPNSWNQMIASGTTKPALTFKITDDFMLPSLDVSVKGIVVQLKTADSSTAIKISGNQLLSMQMTESANSTWKINLKDNTGSLPNSAISTNPVLPKTISPTWKFTFETVPSALIKDGKIDESKLLDIAVVVIYETNFKS